MGINLFISYHSRDSKYLEELIPHLGGLEQYKGVHISSNSELIVGDHWSQESAKEIAKADIILLLLSSDYIASSIIFDKQIITILNDGSKYVIPIILRPCDWLSIGWIRQKQVLPKEGKTISEFEDRDEIYFSISKEITKYVDTLIIKESPTREVNKNIKTNNNDFIFISHDHDDGDFAELLKLKLEKYSFNAWVDVERLKLGEDWREEIDSAISNSFALLVVMSPEARKSEYVTYEWAYGWGKGVKILPIILKETQLHPRLESLQYLDFSDRNSRPWEKLINRLKEIKSGV